MLLATQCPHCHTTFKVAHDQLKLQAGLVRCGVCHEVFNGVEQLTGGKTPVSLVTTPVSPDTPAGPASTADIALNAAMTDAEPIVEPVVESIVKPAFNPVVEPDPTPSAEFAASPADDGDSDRFASLHVDVGEPYLDDLRAVEDETKMPGVLEGTWRTTPDPIDTTAPYIDALMMDQHDIRTALNEDTQTTLQSDSEPAALNNLGFIRQAQVRRRVHWILCGATLLLALILIVQGIVQFRDLLAAKYPQTKSSLTTFCGLLHCQIRLPAQVDAISYEADELHTLVRPGMFEFSLLMRNHSSLGQAWPNIELTMKDSHKQPVIRRVFTPADYLGNARDVGTGFGAGQEQQVKLYFVVQQAPVTDYLVALFYP